MARGARLARQREAEAARQAAIRAARGACPPPASCRAGLACLPRSRPVPSGGHLAFGRDFRKRCPVGNTLATSRQDTYVDPKQVAYRPAVRRTGERDGATGGRGRDDSDLVSAEQPWSVVLATPPRRAQSQVNLSCLRFRLCPSWRLAEVTYTLASPIDYRPPPREAWSVSIYVIRPAIAARRFVRLSFGSGSS